MTDLEKDNLNYNVASNNIFDASHEEPNPTNYDKNGYKKDTTTDVDGYILDNYLIQMYGIEYAKKYPLKRMTNI